MCTYEHLVEVTLAHGRIPLVVPQLRTITLGGAVSGLGIESTSFRSGLPHESVLEMDVLTGAGEVVTTKPGDELFDAFPNSYGSLGYATRLRIELEQVPSYVALRHVRFTDAATLAEAVVRVVEERAWAGERVDAVDGVALRPRRALPHPRAVDRRPRADQRLRRPAGLLPLAAAAQHRPAHRARLPVALGHRLVLVLAGLRRPAPARATGLAATAAALRRLLEARRARPPPRGGRPARPARRSSAGGARRPGRRGPRRAAPRVPGRGSTGRSACARCGCARCGCVAGRTAPATGPGPATRSAPRRPTSTSGFWGIVNVGPDAPTSPRNRAIEAKVSELGGHKSLYSEAFYAQAEFDRLYGGDHLARVKAVHDPDGRLTSLYDKVVQRR